MDANSAAKTGLVNAVGRFDGASADFANAFTRRDGGDPASAAVNLIYARNGVRASAVVLKSVAKTQKALLDIKV
jgi:hypothetical protein